MVASDSVTHRVGFNMSLLEEFAVDLSLSDVERIERYIYSDIDIQRFHWTSCLITRVVHVHLINTLIEKKDIETIRERIIPLLDVIAHDREDMVIMEGISVMASIVKLFAEVDIDETCSLCADLVLPLLWGICSNHIESVGCFADGSLVERFHRCFFNWNSRYRCCSPRTVSRRPRLTECH